MTSNRGMSEKFFQNIDVIGDIPVDIWRFLFSRIFKGLRGLHNVEWEEKQEFIDDYVQKRNEISKNLEIYNEKKNLKVMVDIIFHILTR